MSFRTRAQSLRTLLSTSACGRGMVKALPTFKLRFESRHDSRDRTMTFCHTRFCLESCKGRPEPWKRDYFCSSGTGSCSCSTMTLRIKFLMSRRHLWDCLSRSSQYSGEVDSWYLKASAARYDKPTAGEQRNTRVSSLLSVHSLSNQTRCFCPWTGPAGWNWFVDLAQDFGALMNYWCFPGPAQS